MKLNPRGQKFVNRLLQTRATKSFLRAVVQAIDDTVNVPDLRQNYGATKGRVMRVQVGGISADFRLTERGIEELAQSRDRIPNATVVFDSLDTVMNVFAGKITVREQDGRVVEDPYDFESAFWSGSMEVRALPSERWWSSLMDLDMVLKEILGRLRGRLR